MPRLILARHGLIPQIVNPRRAHWRPLADVEQEVTNAVVLAEFWSEVAKFRENLRAPQLTGAARWWERVNLRPDQQAKQDRDRALIAGREVYDHMAAGLAGELTYLVEHGITPSTKHVEVAREVMRELSLNRDAETWQAIHERYAENRDTAPAHIVDTLLAAPALDPGGAKILGRSGRMERYLRSHSGGQWDMRRYLTMEFWKQRAKRVVSTSDLTEHQQVVRGFLDPIHKDATVDPKTAETRELVFVAAFWEEARPLLRQDVRMPSQNRDTLTAVQEDIGLIGSSRSFAEHQKLRQRYHELGALLADEVARQARDPETSEAEIKACVALMKHATSWKQREGLLKASSAEAYLLQNQREMREAVTKALGRSTPMALLQHNSATPDRQPQPGLVRADPRDRTLLTRLGMGSSSGYRYAPVLDQSTKSWYDDSLRYATADTPVSNVPVAQPHAPVPMLEQMGFVQVETQDQEYLRTFGQTAWDEERRAIIRAHDGEMRTLLDEAVTQVSAPKYGRLNDAQDRKREMMDAVMAELQADRNVGVNLLEAPLLKEPRPWDQHPRTKAVTDIMQTVARWNDGDWWMNEAPRDPRDIILRAASDVNLSARDDLRQGPKGEVAALEERANAQQPTVVAVAPPAATLATQLEDVRRELATYQEMVSRSNPALFQEIQAATDAQKAPRATDAPITTAATAAPHLDAVAPTQASEPGSEHSARRTHPQASIELDNLQRLFTPEDPATGRVDPETLDFSMEEDADLEAVRPRVVLTAETDGVTENGHMADAAASQAARLDLEASREAERERTRTAAAQEIAVFTKVADAHPDIMSAPHSLEGDEARRLLLAEAMREVEQGNGPERDADTPRVEMTQEQRNAAGWEAMDRLEDAIVADDTVARAVGDTPAMGNLRFRDGSTPLHLAAETDAQAAVAICREVPMAAVRDEMDTPAAHTAARVWEVAALEVMKHPQVRALKDAEGVSAAEVAVVHQPAAAAVVTRDEALQREPAKAGTLGDLALLIESRLRERPDVIKKIHETERIRMATLPDGTTLGELAARANRPPVTADDLYPVPRKTPERTQQRAADAIYPRPTERGADRGSERPANQTVTRQAPERTDEGPGLSR